MIAPVFGIACPGIAGWHFKNGRGYIGWGGTGVALILISCLGRMAEGFITQAEGINLITKQGRRACLWLQARHEDSRLRLTLLIMDDQDAGFTAE